MGREFSGEPAKYCYRVLSAAASDNDATSLVAGDIECLNLDFS